MEQIKLFDKNFEEIIKDGVHFLQLDAGNIKDTVVEKDLWTTENSSTLTCSYCRTEFLDSVQQREHYKLDWHRYNLKQNLLSREPVTEEEFDKTDDISSISGSDTEKEDSLENVAVAQGKVFLKASQGSVFSIYRCLLFDKKDELEDSILLKGLHSFSLNSQWTVLMLGGGHFAGGIFQGNVPILHKTFHCYTVRAGQGGSQGARDGRSGTSQPKSAGASLRRYNETSLVQHVRDIVEAWKHEIAKSSLIFYRAAGPYNRCVLFGGKTPLLDRSDLRIRTIPFSTRRATFTELKRVHTLLTTLDIYESVEAALLDLPKQESLDHPNKRSRSKASNIHRSKSREAIERPLPVTSLPSSSSEDSLENNPDHSEEEKQPNASELSTSELAISFKDALQSFEDTLSTEDRIKGNKKLRKPKKTKNQRHREREALRKKKVYGVVCSGDIQQLEVLLENIKAEYDCANTRTEVNATCSENDKLTTDLKHQILVVKPDTINEVLDDGGNTLLHVAAIHQQVGMVRFLLEFDANPCNKNDKQQTPYTCTQNKDVRSVFKDFAQEYPQKYNYSKAQIPVSALSLEEQQEKKKILKKVKREKEKEKKKLNIVKKKEETEKERFLNLSDREKRALAAERRILNQSSVVLSRCFLCAADISGQVPFEYSGNRFCSVECLKAHRLKNPVVLLH